MINQSVQYVIEVKNALGEISFASVQNVKEEQNGL
jgi:hypothetical protein